MNDQLKTLLEEGQTYIKLNDKFKRSVNPDSGPGWLISTKWLDKYKTHIHFEALTLNLTPEPQTKTHPGPIANALLLDTDTTKYLQAPCSLKGMEPEVIDRFLKDDVTEGNDFEVVGEEIWAFLSQKYKFDFEVKRWFYKE